MVTGNYFSGLGVHPVVGRGFLPDEDRAPGEKPVCVLNYNFWREHFQGDPNIAGKPIQINGHAFTIVGVAPQRFHRHPDVQLYARCLGSRDDGANGYPALPQCRTARSEGRDYRWMTSVGRLKPGVTRQQAEPR